MSVEHVHALAKGTRLNQYEVMNILGAGGFGITYMARDTTLDTTVAIKEYLPGDLAVRQGGSQVTAKSSLSQGDFDWGLDRFLAEARTLARFRHPNIVRVNQIFQANNTAYLVMEYAKGQSLDDLLQKQGPLSEEQTKEILFPILDGLKRVHEQGFLHRDIKPGNIIIREEGGAVLIDFGAARQAIETKSRAITSIVTEGYAPLEQYDGMGNQGPWTDIYALGAVAYKCLTGNKPPSATLRVRSDPLVPLAIATKGKVSPTFAAAVEAALHVYENLRPQSIADFSAMIAGTMPVPATASAEDATRVVSAEPATQVVRPSANSYTPSGIPGAKSGPASVSVVAPPPLAATPVGVAAPAAAQPKRSNTIAYLGVAAAIAITIGAAWYVQNGAAPQVATTEPPAPPPPVVAKQEPTPAPAAPPAPAPASKDVASLAPAPPPPVMTGPPVPSAPEPAPRAAAPTPPPSAPAPAPASKAPPAATAKGPAPAPPPQPAVAPAPPPPPAIRASFDCTTPGNTAEQIVCSDGQLAALDVKMAQMYQQGLRSVSDPNAFRGEQQVWLSQRDGCADKRCLAASYDERIKELERWIGP
jgi:serine/threonine protein kinase